MTNRPLLAIAACWFTISFMFGATVLVIGLAPVPLALFLVVPFGVAFLAVGAIWGKHDAILSGELPSQALIFSGIIAFNVTLLLRGRDVGWFLVPLLALTLFVGCLIWARKRAPPPEQ
ncbi:hypothetical protein [Arthrobacter sp. AZCC_0090]|uniref:hypothetical protein n=1 Tax=Arthrobacter sp. AZCC_0090 TaxID=2735881 RepID=UPI00161A931D|nr:hypothetical protein [Arthrobacter sp. AZCC_0090]MBB6407224.1 hypothetical protein [Arthrobacter sp. AZCC_0090]